MVLYDAGESGYEELTLQLAKKWGSDVIRDCDGTKLSDQLLSAGMDVYSTICIIREHNTFINSHPEYQQQVFLESGRVLATSSAISIPLLSGTLPNSFV
jgi:beta-D-galactosyl-(1->4)-L-rhamnose phosphorylase